MLQPPLESAPYHNCVVRNPSKPLNGIPYRTTPTLRQQKPRNPNTHARPNGPWYGTERPKPRFQPSVPLPRGTASPKRIHQHSVPQPRGTKPIGQDQDHSMPQSHGRAIPSRRRTASERFDLLLHNHAGATEPLKIKAPPHRHDYWTIRRPSSSDDGRPRSDAMAAAATTQRHAAARNQQRNRGDHRRHHHSSTGVRRFLAVRPIRGRGLLPIRGLLSA